MTQKIRSDNHLANITGIDKIMLDGIIKHNAIPRQKDIPKDQRDLLDKLGIDIA